MQNNADILDDDTVHSADTDDSYFIKMTLDSVNSFLNQIFLEATEDEEVNIEHVIP